MTYVDDIFVAAEKEVTSAVIAAFVRSGKLVNQSSLEKVLLDSWAWK